MVQRSGGLVSVICPSSRGGTDTRSPKPSIVSHAAGLPSGQGLQAKTHQAGLSGA